MKYDIVEDDIKIGNKIIYGIDKDILDIIHSLEKENQELKADYGNKSQVERDMLQQENRELKKQLEAGEEQYNDLVEKNEKLQEQLSSITLQLEEYKEQVNKGLYNTCLPYTTGYNKAIKDKETQQKEFIKWLESIKFIGIIPIEMVCDKYKEIIGDDK